MDLRHLRYFVAVAEELHFGRAARRLGIAQPPLSQQIRRLEDELGTSLLRRTKRRVELTEPGRVFLQEARATLGQAERAVRQARRASRGETGRLSVGIVPWADFTGVPGAIRTFGERYPDVEVEVQSLASPEYVRALREGQIHVGVTRPPIQSADLKVDPLLSEALVVVFPRRHPFAQYRRIPWRLLERQPYIAFSARRAPLFDALIARACQEAGITLTVKHEADHPQTILALVEAGVGVSLAPASFERVGRPWVAHRRMRPLGPMLETILCWRRDSESPTLRAFVEVVREVLGRTRTEGARSRGMIR